MTKTHHSVRDLRKFRTAAFADITPRQRSTKSEITSIENTIKP